MNRGNILSSHPLLMALLFHSSLHSTTSQMLFSKDKFCIVTKNKLNTALEQVNLALEEGILIPKEALAEGLN